MEHLPEFIMNHWAMSAGFMGVLLLVIFNELQQNLASGASLEPFQVVKLMNREKAVVLDVRSKEIFKKAHIINAILTSLKATESLKKYKKRNVVVVCDNGTQSNTFATALKKDGFEKVSTLKGGMQAWLQAELPTEEK